MAVLNPSKSSGRVVSLLVNATGKTLESEAVDSLELDFTGIVGDSHAGLTRSSCTRVKRQYPEGTEIRNTRQLSALSREELAAIAAGMGIEALEPGWVGANLVIEGIANFSKMPPSSRQIFDSGASLVVDMENAPCRYPGDIIEQYHTGKGRLFGNAALGMRGITLWVERPGVVKMGDTATLHIPPPVTWTDDSNS